MLALNSAVAETEMTPLSSYFEPPPELANDFGNYRSPLLFENGEPVRNANDWAKRRVEIKRSWLKELGSWPELIPNPRIETLEKTNRDNFIQAKIKIELAHGQMGEGYLLIPQGEGPFPAVVVPFYEPETSIGLKGKQRDSAYQLARRGLVTLAIGSPGGDARKPALSGGAECQPLFYLAYVAANCCNALAAMPEVDPMKIGIVGHSYGAKWAMFASCFYEKFACAAWSDGGVVWDESRPNVNYWEPWYLGRENGTHRKPGVITAENPRTGAYKRLVEGGHDLHEIDALMAPRPFLVSGGSEDGPERWRALNHSRAVNRLLGYDNRVAMTNRPTHDPTEESNAVIYEFFDHFLKPRQSRK